MIIPLSYEIPPNVTTPTTLDTFRIPRGFLHRIIIDIPPGWQYMAGFKIDACGITIPAQGYKEEYFTGDDTNLDLFILRNVEDCEAKLIVVNYDTAPHRFVAWLELFEQE